MTAEILQAYLHEHIPLVRAMELEVQSLDEQGVELRAPLRANHNDKQTAFAGSLASALTLAGWSLIHARLGERAQVAIHSSQLSYRRPVTRDIRVIASYPQSGVWDAFVQQLNRRGRSRVSITATVMDARGEIACRSEGSYAAWERSA